MLIAVSWASTVDAQSPYVPPDRYGESSKEAYALIPNLGQVVDLNGSTDTDVKAYTEGSLPQMFMLKGGAMTFAWNKVDTLETTLDTTWSITVEPYGEMANRDIEPVLRSAKTSHENFYLPQCPNGITEVYGFNRVIYENVFPFIDQHVYSGPRGWKMAFVIRPGGNPSHLKYKFRGQDSLGVDVYGFLKVVLGDKWIVLPEAVAYQVATNGDMIPLNWTADFTASNNNGTIGFVVDGYDTTKALVLQIGVPPLALGGGGPLETEGTCWSTYWGGQADNVIHELATDKDANLYAAGETNSAFLTFPGNDGGMELYYGAKTLVLSKLFPTHKPKWTNYYGANTTSQWVRRVVPDGRGNVYMVGACIPSYLTPTLGVNYTPSSSNHGFITRFETVNGVMDWSTSYNNILDASVDLMDGQLVVSGYSISTIFEPATQPSGSTYYSHATGNINDAYVAKFKLDGQLMWSTYLGGTDWDQAWSVAAGSGQIAVGLRTLSEDIPLLTPNGDAYAQVFGGGGEEDIYVYRFTAAGLHEWGSYYGGSDLEHIRIGGLDIHPTNGDIAICGQTQSTDLPIEPGPGWYLSTLGNSILVGSFAAKFSGQNDGLLWSSYIQANNDYPPYYGQIMLTQARFGNNNSLFFSGHSTTANFDWAPAPSLYNASTLVNARDGFILWLDHNINMRWSTLFGGEEDSYEETINSIAYCATSNTLYASGITKANYASGEFFPLTDPGIPAYFREIAIDPKDSFISAFCLDNFTGIENQANVHPEPSIFMLNNKQLGVMGLSAGRHVVQIMDMAGRVVHRGSINAFGDAMQTVGIPTLASGIYAVSVGDAATRVRIAH